MRLKQISLILFSLAFSLLALKYLPNPYLWIFFLWSSTGLLGTFFFHRPFLRLGAFNCCVIMLLLFGLESFYYLEDVIEANKKRFENVYSFITGHPILGYANLANSQFVARKFYDNQLTYEASFTHNSSGLRITKPIGGQAPSTNESIIFFGGSFSWGEGVNDDQSLPYTTNSLTGGKFSVYNFGAPGYGPQHMLSAIEHGIVDSIVKEHPRVVIYQAIVDHMYRVAGMRKFTKGGPRYLLGRSGEVIYAGNFLRCHPAYDNCFLKRVKRQVNKSYIFQRLVLKRINNNEIEIFMKVINKSRKLLEEKYPKVEFYVLFWHKPQNRISNEILRAFQERDFNVLLIQQIIPDYNEHRNQYHILHDGHPTALAYRKLGHFIADTLITPDKVHPTTTRPPYVQFQKPYSSPPKAKNSIKVWH